jgi:hypothetical protein
MTMAMAGLQLARMHCADRYFAVDAIGLYIGVVGMALTGPLGWAFGAIGIGLGIGDRYLQRMLREDQMTIPFWEASAILWSIGLALALTKFIYERVHGRTDKKALFISAGCAVIVLLSVFKH